MGVGGAIGSRGGAAESRGKDPPRQERLGLNEPVGQDLRQQDESWCDGRLEYTGTRKMDCREKEGTPDHPPGTPTLVQN